MIPAERLVEALEATWPPAEIAQIGGWRLRRGIGGGSRVSSVRPLGDPGEPVDGAIAKAERIMRGWGQRPLFQLTDADAALAAELSARSYAVKDPTVFMAAPAEALAARDLAPVRQVECAAPLAAMEAIWALDDVGPARLAVMERAKGPKTYFALRLKDRIAGVAFVAVDRDVALLHALVVDPALRRCGVGVASAIASARFGLSHGTETLALAVTEANAPALALYRGVGLVQCGGYRYLAAPD